MPPANAGHPRRAWLRLVQYALEWVGLTLLGVFGGRLLARALLGESGLPEWWPGLPVVVLLALTNFFLATVAMEFLELRGVFRSERRSVAAAYVFQALLAAAISFGHHALRSWVVTLLFWAGTVGAAVVLARRLPSERSRRRPVSGLPRQVRACMCVPAFTWMPPVACRCVPGAPPLRPQAAPADVSSPAIEKIRLAASARRPAAAVPGAGDLVDCSVFAPPEASPGARILVQTFVHTPERAAEAEALAAEFDDGARRRGFTSLETAVVRGAKLGFYLHMPNLSVDDPVQELVWRGLPSSVQFGVTIPGNHPVGNVIGTLTVSLDSVPMGHVKFKLKVAAVQGEITPEPLGDQAQRYRMAFISYASADRGKVLPRVQMLQAVGIRFFQDTLDLDPGVRWERELYRHIDECDLFLLFWSSAARKSEWVMKEVQYALQRKGGDDLRPPEIRPVILEGPPIVPPPPELAHLHFNDRLIYLMVHESI